MKNPTFTRLILFIKIALILCLSLNYGRLSAQISTKKPVGSILLKITTTDSIKILANLYAVAKLKLEDREARLKAFRDTLDKREAEERRKIKEARKEAKKEGLRQGSILGGLVVVSLEVVGLILFR